MAPPDFFEHGNRPDAGGRLQDRHNLAIPNLGQGGPAAVGQWDLPVPEQ
jgi:hypothetical protein